MLISIEALLSAMPVYKYGLLFLLTMIEGPLVTMFAGWAGFEGYLNLFIAYAVIICADIVSDSIYYGIGFWGRKKIIEKYVASVGESANKFKKIEALLYKHSGKTLVISKLTHLAGVPFLIAAGIVKMSFSKFLLYDVIATIPKSLLLIMIGYYFGRSTSVINQYLEYGTLIVSSLIIVIFIAYFYVGKYYEKKLLKNN